MSQASRILHKFIEPVAVQEASVSPTEVTSGDESPKSELVSSVTLVDYSNMFGEEFQLPDDQWDSNYLNTLDLGAVEEGILHVLYACASQVNCSNRVMERLMHIYFFSFSFFSSLHVSVHFCHFDPSIMLLLVFPQPILCSKLAGRTSDFWSALPLVQALLPGWVSISRVFEQQQKTKNVNFLWTWNLEKDGIYLFVKLHRLTSFSLSFLWIGSSQFWLGILDSIFICWSMMTWIISNRQRRRTRGMESQILNIKMFSNTWDICEDKMKIFRATQASSGCQSS